MKVHIRISPIAGFCEQRQEIEVVLKHGSKSEVETLLYNKLGVNPFNMEAIMFLLNGRGLEPREDVVFQDGDQLWLLPQLSGG